MASEKLTALKVERARTPGLLNDGKGLYLRIAASKTAVTKSWVFRFMIAGRAREMGLGSLDVVSLSEARERARKWRRLVKEGVDPLGYYLPPYAYAMMQVLDQSIKATGGLDQAKLSDYMHKSEFDTYVGKVRFAKNGEWAQPRMLTVQYHGISGSDLEQWKKPGRVTILAPSAYMTGAVMAPYHDNKK